MCSGGGKIPCFRGLVIHCNAFLDDGMPMTLRNAIESGGGIYSSKFVPSRVTHVVWRNGNNATLRAAQRNNIHIVGPSWVHESVKTGRKKDETNYPPCEMGQSKTPRSARKLWRNSLDDVSRLASPDDFRFSSSQPDPELLIEQEASSVNRTRDSETTKKCKRIKTNAIKKTGFPKKTSQSKMTNGKQQLASTTAGDLDDDDSINGTSGWTCEHCTLINISSTRRCTACDHRRLVDVTVPPLVKAIVINPTITSTMLKGNNKRKRSCNPDKKPSKISISKQLNLDSVSKENMQQSVIDDTCFNLDENDCHEYLDPPSVMKNQDGGDANTPVVTAGFPRYEDSSPVKLPSAPHLQRGDGETASYAVSPLHDRKRASGSLRRAYNRPQIALSGHSCDTTKTLAMAAKFLPHNIINEEQVKKCTHLVIRDDGQRTLKILFALCLGGKKIVNASWILESLSNGKWLDEKAYESRRYSRHAPSHPLQGMHVHVCESSDPPRAILEKLVRASGAKTVSSISMAELLLVGSMEDGKKLIQNGGSDITAIAEANRIRTSRWLFDSIEGGKVVNIADDDRYTVHMDAQEESGGVSQDF